MDLKLTITIVEIQGVCFTGWVDQIKGIIAQGNSNEEVIKELRKLLRIKLELSLGIEKTNKVVAKTYTPRPEFWSDIPTDLFEKNMIKDSISVSVA